MSSHDAGASGCTDTSEGQKGTCTQVLVTDMVFLKKLPQMKIIAYLQSFGGGT